MELESTAAAAQPASVALNELKTMAALANDIRWQAMKMMSDGSTLTITDLAQVMNMGTDGVGKHLIVLRNAGVAEFAYGEDARFNVYSIPKRFLREPGVVDFGFCTLRFPTPKKPE
ncbi:MAG: hypothetical protein ABIT76_14910 [Chthoniobacterales bacterium]